MEILHSPPETRRTNRMLATVAVTLLAGAATAFVMFHHRPMLAGEARLASASGVDPPTAVAANADPSLPAATEVFAKSPPKDEDACASF